MRLQSSPSETPRGAERIGAAALLAAGGGSMLDPFKAEVHRLLGGDARMPSQRIRELLAERGYRGKTITDDYVRDVRPLFLAARTHQRTS